MRIAKFARKIIILSIGFPLLIVGIILIPLPGPGLLISLAAFFILSFELDWAERFYEDRKADLKKIYDDSKKRYDESTEKLN